MVFLTRPHIVALPKWFLVLRILQIVLAVAALGILGFLTSLYPAPGFCLGLFTGVSTLIIVTWFLIASLGCPSAYNKWAVLAVEIFGIIFWISTMGVLASYTAQFSAAISLYNDLSSSYDSGSRSGSSYTPDDCLTYPSNCYKKRSLNSLTKRDAGYEVDLGLTGGAAGLAAIEFCLFCTTLIAFSVFLHRHRIQEGSSLDHTATQYSTQVPKNESYPIVNTQPERYEQA